MDGYKEKEIIIINTDRELKNSIKSLIHNKSNYTCVIGYRILCSVHRILCSVQNTM